MNHLSGSYQLFGGYNPIVAAVEEYLRLGINVEGKMTSHEDSTTVCSEENKEVVEDKETVQKKESKLPLVIGIERYIPRIDSEHANENFRLHRQKLKVWRNQASIAEQNKDYSTAMIFYKKICELTVFEPSNWKTMLSLAQIHFKKIVPDICKQILIYCPNVNLQQEAKRLLNSKI